MILCLKSCFECFEILLIIKLSIDVEARYGGCRQSFIYSINGRQSDQSL